MADITRRFVADSGLGSQTGGNGTFIKIDDEAQPYFQFLLKNHPRVLQSIMSSLGFNLRKDLRDAVKAGGPPGVKWQPRSWLAGLAGSGNFTDGLGDLFGRRQSGAPGKRVRLKESAFSKRLRGQAAKTASVGTAFQGFAEGFLATRGTSFGKVGQTMAYKNYKDKFQVQIGWLGPSAAFFGRAVQAAYRGYSVRQGAGDFAGDQPITSQMRKAFWAAGIGMSKSKRTIHQSERPLTKPVFDMDQGKIQSLALTKMQLFIADPTSDAWRNT